ncbi:MCE family protein [Mycobacterium sp. CVI_P3]|uniref:MCE family protein n=1 Tax=Mycobacterium pinniadriaticum TaxID=2994102 RepID=A0ABT3SPQ7_9MYCO|nr:MCE family protein [Mycobacterium pinniadriaticum]MCX2934751.1 MCE family protein [Mycobacterium pinniadriaticum]MCX2941173.1 MCE family protein [Mycobacterium pinniadriaticum]
MRAFSERNSLIVGAIGLAVVAAVVVGALQYKKLPFFHAGRQYSAYFSEASGLHSGAPVQVAGLKVGEVTSLELDDTRVLVKFDVDKSVRMGDRTEAAIKTKSLLGAKILEIFPRGDKPLSEVIPIDRTTPAYQLPDALGDLANTISGLNTDELNKSLTTLAQTFKDTPPDLKAAVEGVARFSQTLDERDAQVRGLLDNARKVTGVLAQRSDQVVGLIANTNALLVQLNSESTALEQISRNIVGVTRQLSGFIADNKSQLRPSLDKLNGVLTILDNRKERIQISIKKLNEYAMSLGEVVASGPFFKAYIANLLPGQFVQPFVDAAFSDLGLDPNVLLPSERTDPQVGQPATPALPVPYPRTGQGGDPALNLPDAITGKPGDPRYTYREPEPGPPPGGPPPGPPANSAPENASVPLPTPSPVHQPAPGEAPASAGSQVGGSR